LVQCSNGVWSAWSASRRFVTAAPPTNACSAPSLNDLSVSNIRIDRATLNSVNSTAIHEWRYRAVGDADWIAHTGSASQASLSALYPATDYQFNVRVQCNGTWSNWSADAYFITLAESSGCTEASVSQLSATSVTNNSATLNCSVTGRNRYVARYRLFGTLNWTLTPQGSSSTRFLSGLLAGRRYEFQYSFFCSTGVQSIWSASAYFTTTGTANLIEPVTDENPGLVINPNIRLLLYPNPATVELNLQYHLPHKTQLLRYQIMDLQGRTLQQGLFGERNAGDYRETIQLNKLAKGMYVLTLQNDQLRSVQRFTVLD
jgi:Secretion system C-terminal sorting domain